MALPAFSVIIPVFNGAATIGRAIESVLAQSFTDYELIVVDDGSRDDTPRVIEHFGAQVTYLRQPNAGVSAARNRGAQFARGEWLAFLDADDWYYADRLRWHADCISRHAHLDFLTGDYEYRAADGSLIGRSMELTAAGLELLQKAREGREAVMELDDLAEFIENHFGDTHTLSVPRRTFLALGGYPVGQPVCEDVHLLIRLCCRSRRVGVICQPMAAYVIHPNSATRRDPLRSQRLTVSALDALRPELRHAPRPIRRGYKGRLRRARLNLAYTLLKQERPFSALAAVLPLLKEDPGILSLRDLASVALGALPRLKF